MNLARIFITTLFILIMLGQTAFCAGNYRVLNIVVDNSDKLILIKGLGNYKHGLETVEVPTPGSNSLKLINNITAFTITSPARYVVDIPNATLDGASRTYKIQNSSVLQSVQLAQFSTNPHIVRAVFTLAKSTDLGKFRTYTNGTDIFVKYTPQVINNSLQYKFYTPTGDTGVGSGVHDTSTIVTYNNTNEVKEIIPRFKTKYYLSQISQNSDGLILRGIGSISHQKATFSPDNTKVSFFLDNASMTSKLDGKTFRIPSSQAGIQGTLTVNRVNSKKIKLTINGSNVRDYRFVISPDGQSLFISHRNYIINTIFSANPAIIKQYKAQTTQTGYKLIEMFFDKSVAYDIFELNDNLYLDVNNLGDFNQALLDEMLSTTDIKVQAIKISSDKTRFIIPSSNLNFAYANVESNAKSIKLVFKDKPIIATEPKEEPIIIIPPINAEEKIGEITEKLKEKTVDKINEKISEKINEKVIYIPKEDVPKIEKPKKPKEKPTISSMKKVVIDPGHGGTDSGAIGGGVYEKTINLDVAKRVQEILIKKNVYVYMTRSKDETLTLEDRVNYSNEINPNVYVSIHTNSTVKEDSYGLETHYFKDDSYKLAQIIHKNFASERNIRKWDTMDRGVIKSRFYVINHTEAPSVLIEIGFISNLEERSKLLKKGRREDIAEAIADGILEYLKIR